MLPDSEKSVPAPFARVATRNLYPEFPHISSPRFQLLREMQSSIYFLCVCVVFVLLVWVCLGVFLFCLGLCGWVFVCLLFWRVAPCILRTNRIREADLKPN